MVNQKYTICTKLSRKFFRTGIFLILCFSVYSAAMAQNPVNLAGHMGKVTKEDLQNDEYKTGWFDMEFGSYEPTFTPRQKKVISSRDFQVVIILGTWCSDSRKQVPRLFKIFSSLGISPQITLITTDKTKKVIEPGFVDITAQYVPLIIFRNNKGEDIGEIIETPKKSLEADMTAILKKIK